MTNKKINIQHKLSNLYSVIVLVVIILVSISTYVISANKTFAESSVFRRGSISLACKAFPIESAKKHIGTDITTSNVETSENKSDDGIFFEDKNVIVSNCAYVQNHHSPSVNADIIVGVRDSKNDKAKNDQRQAFFANKMSGEQPLVVDNYDGFYLEHDDKTIDLRIWAKDRWIEVNAPNLDIGSAVAKELVQNI